MFTNRSTRVIEPEKNTQLSVVTHGDELILSALSGNVSEIIKRSGAYRNEMDPKSLGRLAAAVLLAQFKASKAETSLRWVPNPRLLINAAYGIVYVGAPLALIGAGLAVDIAVFGGAAEDLMQVSPYFKAMAVGSLIFAVGIGLSKGFNKSALMGLMLLASAGASVITADNPALIHKFSDILPNSLTETKNGAAGDALAAKSQVDYWKKIIADDTQQLNTGGRNGLPILGDGFTGNDEQGHLLEKQITDAQSQLAAATSSAARAENQQFVTASQSPDQFYGKLIAAGYIWTFLAASQIGIASILDRLGHIISEERTRDSNHRVKRLSWKMLKRYDAAVEAQSGLIISDFESKLAEAAESNPGKAEKLSNLFSGSSLEQMQWTAGNVFRQAVPRSYTFFERVKKIFRQPLPNIDGPFRLSGFGSIDAVPTYSVVAETPVRPTNAAKNRILESTPEAT